MTGAPSGSDLADSAAPKLGLTLPLFLAPVVDDLRPTRASPLTNSRPHRSTSNGGCFICARCITRFYSGAALYRAPMCYIESRFVKRGRSISQHDLRARALPSCLHSQPLNSIYYFKPDVKERPIGCLDSFRVPFDRKNSWRDLNLRKYEMLPSSVSELHTPQQHLLVTRRSTSPPVTGSRLHLHTPQQPLHLTRRSTSPPVTGSGKRLQLHTPQQPLHLTRRSTSPPVTGSICSFTRERLIMRRWPRRYAAELKQNKWWSDKTIARRGETEAAPSPSCPPRSSHLPGTAQSLIASLITSQISRQLLSFGKRKCGLLVCFTAAARAEVFLFFSSAEDTLLVSIQETSCVKSLVWLLAKCMDCNSIISRGEQRDVAMYWLAPSDRVEHREATHRGKWSAPTKFSLTSEATLTFLEVGSVGCLLITSEPVMAVEATVVNHSEKCPQRSRGHISGDTLRS
ncbi:hypothetical protein J6590_027045 [Homalodisca vitripennis]|nr:hypothetical protein J6590_027045 [Homalodisca vitripennis]